MTREKITPHAGLRIGFDAKRAFNNGTGLGNYSRFVISSLVKLYPQHHYFLFTPGIKPEFKDWIADGGNVSIVTPQSPLGKVVPSMWRTYAIADLCNAMKLDVYHGLSNELPVGIQRFKGKKLVTIHDLIFLRYPDYYGAIDRYIYTKKFEAACEKADLVLAASDQTKQDVIRYFDTDADKIKITYQDCDQRFLHKAGKDELNHVLAKYDLPLKYILCVGTIEERKDQLTVLKAFHQLNDASYKLVFIGRQTDYAQQLHQYISSNGLMSDVMFLKNVPASDLPLIYQASSAFVYASEFEGFGIPILEGLRSGVPVISARNSSLTEVGGEAVLYFNSKDATALKNCMQQALYDEEVRTVLLEKAARQASRFDTGLLMQQLAGLYSA